MIGAIAESRSLARPKMPPAQRDTYSPVIGGREASDAEVGTRLGRFSGAADRRVMRDRS